MESPVINFMTVAVRWSEIFVGPYVVSSLLHNPQSVCELFVESMPDFTRRYDQLVAILQQTFTDRLRLQQLPGDLVNRLYPDTLRWVLRPSYQAEFTYIGDVDILILDKDIAWQHRAIMEDLQLPYSNIIRPNRLRLSGLHCVNTVEYFKRFTEAEAQHWSCINQDGEALLYQICQSLFGLPSHPVPRPLHGLHTTFSRPLAGWCLEDRYHKSYIALLADPVWLAIQPLFPAIYQTEFLDKITAFYEQGKTIGDYPGATRGNYPAY